MATDAAARPSTTCSIFKLKHRSVKATSEEVFDKKKAPSTAASRKPAASNRLPPLKKSAPNSRPQTSASVKSDNNVRFGSFSKSSFFSRHNPHPVRVRHIRGLNGVPICSVNDEGYFPASPRLSLENMPTTQQRYFLEQRVNPSWLGVNSKSFPIDPITGIQNYPYKEKAVPRFGLIPITDAWRDELSDFCCKAGLINPQQQQPVKVEKESARKRRTQYSATTGRLIPPPSRASSRMSSRSTHSIASQPLLTAPLNHISVYPDSETLMLNMLCQILQTDSVNDVQQWLVSAGEREKAMVLDLIKSGIGSDEQQQQADNERAEGVESRLHTAASRMSLRSAAASRISGELHGEVVLPALDSPSRPMSRASTAQSGIRPLGSIPKVVDTEVIIEEDEE